MTDNPLIPEFIRRNSTFYEVYHAQVGDDLVYQFWPRGQDPTFPPGFGVYLESPFRSNLSPTMPVEADYHDLTESKLLGLMRPDGGETLQEMIYVKIIDGGKLIGNRTILRGKLFDELDELLRVKYAVSAETTSGGDSSPAKVRSRRSRRLLS